MSAPTDPGPSRAVRRTHRVTPTERALTEYRRVVRTAIDPAGGDPDQASPIHPFVLAHADSVESVREALGVDEPPMIVHVDQTVVVHALVRPGRAVHSEVTVDAIRPDPRGARLVVRTVVDDEDGAVAELTTGVLAIGTGPVRPFGTIGRSDLPMVDGDEQVVELALPRPFITAYAEVSGDDNPIHLDRAAAAAAGYPDVIAHGMSALAVVCELILDRHAAGDAAALTGVGARFAGPILPDEPIDVRLRVDAGHTTVRFNCSTPRGPAIKNGWARLTPRSIA